MLSFSRNAPVAAATAITALSSFSLFGPEVARAEVVRNTLSVAQFPPPVYNYSDQMIATPYSGDGDLRGRFLAVQQTIGTTQSGATASLTLDASLYYQIQPGLYDWVRPVDFGPTGSLRDNPIRMWAHWVDAQTFDPASPASSIVSSHVIGRSGTAPVASGRNSVTNRQTMLFHYDLPAPQVTSDQTFFLLLALEIPSLAPPRPTMEIQAAIPRSDFITEAPNDFIFNRGPSSAGFNSFGLQGGPARLAAIRLDIPTVPGPGAASVLAIAGGLAATRRRR
jgi:hypothetical protein